ncbi:MAG TPA: helix-turn-helix domain-containing protein [Acidimicrobiales bacterium]|nr:helix-turn-helix domain-containing protein [Acidimicrobiales bacterium]
MNAPSNGDLLRELLGDDGDSSALASRLLRTGEVARLFQVSQRTVYEWARRGRIPTVRTPSGQHRYPAAAVRQALLEAAGGAVAEP